MYFVVILRYFVELLDYLYDVYIITDGGVIRNLSGGTITNQYLLFY